MAFPTKKLIFLAKLLFQQYINHKQTSLSPNKQYWSAQQYAYQSVLSYFLILIPFAPK